MKYSKFKHAIAAAVVCSLAASNLQQANASILSGLLFGGEQNLLSDESAEFIINKTGTAPGSLDIGDILVTSVTIRSITGVTNGGNILLGTGGNAEITALSVIQVATKVPTGSSVLLPIVGLTPTFDFTFTPVVGDAVATALFKAALRDGLGSQTAAEAALISEFGTWSAGSMLAAFGDTTPDWTRIGSPDDGAPDLGVGPFASEAALVALAFNGVKQFEAGFAPVPVGSNIFWSADDSIDALGVFASIPLTTAGGSFDFGLDFTLPPDFASILVPNLDPVGLTIGTSQVVGSGNLFGKAGATTPFDVFDRVDVTIHPVVPEPLTAVIWIGLAVVGGATVKLRKSRS